MNVEQSDTQPKTFFSVEYGSYSGPLDLLINLIEKRKFLVNDISLVAVTDDYMEYVSRFENNPLKDMADFIVLASTLMLLKSKSLLPVLELTEAEEESVDSLERRLRYYQIFRNVGKVVQSEFGKNISFEKQFTPSERPLFIVDKCTTTENLSSSMSSVLSHLPVKKEKPRVAVKKVVSLESMIGQLKERVEKQFHFSFNEFAKNEKERSTVIVGFLAVLELVKQGNLLVKQTAQFHEIHIEQRERVTPRYQ